MPITHGERAAPRQRGVAVGVLGAGGIPGRALIEPARRRSDVVVHAVGSRSRDKAVAYAAQHAIPVAYGSYREVIDDPEVTLVYNALPPSEHARWSIAALQAGKHVLCEKPVAFDAHEAAQVAQAAAAADRQVIEAYHDRYHPMFSHLLTRTRSAELGAIREVRAEVRICMPFSPDSFRHDPTLGGGALMEFGCYAVRWLRDVVGEQPDVVEATAELNPIGGDSQLSAELRFPGGATGRLMATALAPAGVASLIEVVGEHGTIRVDNPIVPHAGHVIHECIGNRDVTHTVAGATSYDYQLDAVVRSIESGVPALTSGTDFVRTMSLIDALYRAAGVHRKLC